MQRTTDSFISRVSTLTRDIDIAILSVHLSVRDTLVLYENDLTYRHSFFNHTVAQSFCFTSIKHLNEISTGCECDGGAKYRLGIKMSRFSTISRYISQTIQDITIVTMEGE